MSIMTPPFSPLSKWAMHRDSESRGGDLGHSVSGTLNLRCLCDIQVKMSSKEYRRSRERSGLVTNLEALAC